MPRTVMVAAVLLVGSLPEAAAGQHPDRFGVHAVVPLYEESDLHRGGGVSWRKQIGRGWGLHAVYDVSTPGDHWDHAASMWVAKSFGPPDDSVPYLLVGGAGIGYHTYREGEGGVWAAPGIGAGLTHWNARRSWYWAPEIRFGVSALATVSVTIGFAKR